MDRLYSTDRATIKTFITSFTHVDETESVVVKYRSSIEKVAGRVEKLITMDVADLYSFNHDLARALLANTSRYDRLFVDVVEELLACQEASFEPDTVDISNNTRRIIYSNLLQTINKTSTTNSDIEKFVPKEIMRRFEIAFKLEWEHAISIRDIGGTKIGKLVCFEAVVIRTSNVQPKLTVVVYCCSSCGLESFQCVEGLSFTPLNHCNSPICKHQKKTGQLTWVGRLSKFIKFQRITAQEPPDKVPSGHMPKSITIFAHGELTRRCNPGDFVLVTGIPSISDETRQVSSTAKITREIYIEARHISHCNKSGNIASKATTDEAGMPIAEEPIPMDRLIRSLAPEIHGLRDLKEALLLSLVGGKSVDDQGLKIRGNINICIIGDPGLAKSQLLNFISQLADRSQYASGRGSSGVGLTASVGRDPATNEFSLEAGALVLADGGICCIDEFDKMRDIDRTAIHEAMEQQTLSIAKAGITANLNARTTIIAAANPVDGRYNVFKTAADNINLRPALLSRFDLIWLITDSPNEESDTTLANFITGAHGEHVNDYHDILKIDCLRQYIKLCKTKNPTLPRSLDDKLVAIYKDIRDKQRNEQDPIFTSPRTLLGIIRLSTAHAKLRLSEIVSEADIEEAVRLFKCSRNSIGAGLPLEHE